jgi:hypothetical protein
VDDHRYTRADLHNFASHNLCLFRYNFAAVGACALAPFVLLIIIFNPPSFMPAMLLWIVFLVIATPLLYLLSTAALDPPSPLGVAIASLRHRNGAIWLLNEQLHFFDCVVPIEQVDYLVRKPKYGFGDFELHLIDGRQVSFPDILVVANFR